MGNISINQYDYISFDVFDTLIKRTAAQPADLFRLMEVYGKAHGISVPERYAEQRIAAARNAALRFSKPVTLRQIYFELEQQYARPLNDLMELELYFELKGCRPHIQNVGLFRQCLQNGKTVVLTSDMYLSSEVIGKMLDKCGVTGYKKLYVSCEAGCGKANGELYKKVLEDLGIPSRKLLHIGDNRKRDVWIPRFMGIHTRYVPNNQKKLSAIPSAVSPRSALVYRTLKACAENTAQQMTPYAALGCRTLGPVLAGFTEWLAKQLRYDGIYNVYFLSRDGYTLKRAFDTAYAGEFQTHYLFSSRRSYSVPLFCKYSSLEDVFKRIFFLGRTTLRSFIIRVGLEPEQCVTYAKNAGLDLDAVFEIDAFRISKKVALFYESIRPMVIENSQREYAAVLAYIKSLHMQEKIAVVDIGRLGTIQGALEQIISEGNLNIEVRGYYVAVNPSSDLVKNGIIQAKGYLYERGKNENYSDLFYSFLPIFESAFLAPHGSVKRFVLKNGKAEVELYPYEYDETKEKYVDEMKIMGEYQEGALRFVSELSSAFPGGLPSIPADAAACNYIRMGLHPTQWESDMWGDFRVFDNITMLTAHPAKLKEYITSPLKLRADFLLSPWKIGFMRRLFRFPAPYDKTYFWLKRLYHKK